jgi:hypothetical protein
MLLIIVLRILRQEESDGTEVVGNEGDTDEV